LVSFAIERVLGSVVVPTPDPPHASDGSNSTHSTAHAVRSMTPAESPHVWVVRAFNRSNVRPAACFHTQALGFAQKRCNVSQHPLDIAGAC
jgi:hypothetical protein